LASKLKSKRDDWPSLVASSNFFPPSPKTADTVVHPLLVHILSPKNIIKKQSILGKNYYSRPSFTKSTSLPTTIVEKKKNEWCYLLLTYVLHCKKKRRKNKAKSTKQTLSRLSQTGRTNFVCQQSSA